MLQRKKIKTCFWVLPIIVYWHSSHKLRKLQFSIAETCRPIFLVWTEAHQNLLQKVKLIVLVWYDHENAGIDTTLTSHPCAPMRKILQNRGALLNTKCISSFSRAMVDSKNEWNFFYYFFERSMLSLQWINKCFVVCPSVDFQISRFPNQLEFFDCFNKMPVK